MDLYIELFLLATFLSITFNVILKKFQMPTIMGYIITGILLSLFLDLKHNEEIDYVAEFGIVFLMFTIGLEFSVKHLLQMKKEVFFNGGLQVLLSGTFFAIIFHKFFGLDEKISIIAGFAFALSSTAIVLKTLNDSGDIKQPYGRKALGILLFQDIAVIPILLMLDIFTSTSGSIGFLIFKTLMSAIIVLTLLYLVAKFVFDFVLKAALTTKSEEIFIGTVLFIVIASSFIAHFFGFSYSLGAFIAGMLLAETKYKYAIEADLIPFRDLFLGLFFIIVGLEIKLNIIFSHFFTIVFLVIIVMAMKTAIIYLVVRLGGRRVAAIKAALSLCQVGEFALAIFSLAVAKSLLEPTQSQIFIAVAVITMFLTPFILKAIAKINEADVPKYIGNVTNEELKALDHHIIVIGYGRIGQEIVKKLKNQKIPYIAIENDIDLVDLAKLKGDEVFLGDATKENILEKAHIREASAVILTMTHENHLIIIAQKLKLMDVKVPIIIRYKGLFIEDILGDLGRNFYFIKEEKALARVFINEALSHRLKEESVI